MDVPDLRGTIVRLRAIRPEDSAERLALGRDPEFVRLNGGDPSDLSPFTEADAIRWLNAFPRSLRWAIQFQGRLVGESRLDQVDRVNRSARFAIGIFSSRFWDQGIGRESTKLTLQHAFEAERLHRVDLNVLAFNERAISLYDRLGFKTEGVLRDTLWLAGRWFSDIRMSMLDDEWREVR